MATIDEVLCPSLYARLERAFGSVIVANRGERLAGSLRTDRSGKRRLMVSSSGEYLRVSCPFCSDRRHRLWISHRWAEFPHLARCFNETFCLDGQVGERNRRQLQQWVFNSDRPVILPVAEGRPPPDSGPLVEVGLPGEFSYIDEAADTQAYEYVVQRDFDPAELAAVYGVGVCRSVFDPAHYPLVGRVFIPIVQGGRLVGWQGRFPADLDWKEHPRHPKYFNLRGMPKRRMLYNLDEARRRDVAVLVEGVTDVWSVGPCGISLLGCSLNQYHRELIHAVWGGPGKFVIVLLDGEAADDNAAMTADLHRDLAPTGCRVASVVLPDGCDPGGMTRRACWQVIFAQTAGLGIVLPDSVRCYLET